MAHPHYPPMARWRLRAVAIGVLLAVVAGCGFHLRGSGQSRLSLKGLYVEGRASDQFIHELSDSLDRAGASVVGKRSDARYIVNLTGEQATKSVLTVSPTGQVLEYELHYAVTFEAMDKTGRRLISPKRVSAVRDVTFNPSAALGKANEEQQLYAHLHREVINQIIMRLRTKLSP